MVTTEAADEFLSCGRIALVGASDDKGNFGRTIREALVEHGIDVVVINPTVETVGGEVSHPSLADVPDAVDGVLVVVSGQRSLDAVREAAEAGVRRVWLFKGIGGPGAASPEAVELAEDLGLEVVAGACPLMFLEPVGGVHKLHRGMRRLRGSLRAS